MGTHWRARTNVRTDLGGGEHPFARDGAYSTRAGFSNSNFDERTKERAALTFATVFWSLVFAIPLILAGIMLGSR